VAPDLASPPNDRVSPWESEELYHLLVQSVVDYAIFLLDPGGRIRTWNAGAERLKGYRPEEIIGEHFSIFYSEEDRAASFPTYELQVARREGRFEDEGWRFRKDGSRFWANVVITALWREDELVAFAKVTRDLTDRKRAEEERERLLDNERAARRDAEVANRAKMEFLSTMSHELRTPLNAIAGFTDVLSLGIYGPVSEKQAGVLDRIRHNQEHLLTLLNDLLHFAKIQAGTLEVRRRSIPVRAVLEDLNASILPQLETRGLHHAIEAPDPELWVRGDRARIEQILVNLIANAVKFTEPGGRIAIRAEWDESVVRLLVSDTGLGIPPEKLEEIFDPFVQVRDSQLGDFSRQGVGLGLAISRELARAMEGDLTVRSAPAEGSTFTLTLPRAEAAEAGETE
jgi:PAS domain S-box-containing protein